MYIHKQKLHTMNLYLSVRCRARLSSTTSETDCQGMTVKIDMFSIKKFAIGGS